MNATRVSSVRRQRDADDLLVVAGVSARLANAGCDQTTGRPAIVLVGSRMLARLDLLVALGRQRAMIRSPFSLNRKKRSPVRHEEGVAPALLPCRPWSPARVSQTRSPVSAFRQRSSP